MSTSQTKHAGGRPRHDGRPNAGSAEARILRTWSWDQGVFFYGPLGLPNPDPLMVVRNHGSEYYNPIWASSIDLADKELMEWVWKILEGMGMPMNVICAFFDLYDDSEKKGRPRTPLSDMLTSLARFRMPGQLDRHSRLFHEALNFHWPSLDWFYFQPQYRSWEQITVLDMMAKPKGLKLGPFGPNTIRMVNGILAKWREHIPPHSDDELADWILRLGGDKSDIRLPENLLLSLIGFKSGRLPLSLYGGSTSTELRRLIAHLQQAVLRGDILSDSRFPISDWDRVGTRRCLQTQSGARKGCLLAVREHVNLPEIRFPEMRKILVDAFKKPLAERGVWFERLAQLAFPASTILERQSFIKQLNGYALGHYLGVRSVTTWTSRHEVILLKQALELGSKQGVALAQCLRRYQVPASPKACEHRLSLLLTQPGRQALDLLRRSCPAWWTAMLLGSDCEAAFLLLTSESFGKRVLKRGVSSFAGVDVETRYEDLIDELVEEDETQAFFMPVEPMDDADILKKWLSDDPLEGCSVLPDEAARVGQTRIAVFRRHAVLFRDTLL